MDLELQRLYLLYQAGSKTDGKATSHLLQVANAVGNDLSIEEFEELASQVKDVTQRFDPSKQSAKFQEVLWQIPEELIERRNVDFSPVRTVDNEPVEVDDASPEALQELLRTKSLEDVQHNSALRNAWFAAQEGKFADIANSGNLWMLSNDSDVVESGLSGIGSFAESKLYGPAIKNLFFKSINENTSFKTLQEALDQERKEAAELVPSTDLMRHHDAEDLRDRILLADGNFDFIPESLRNDEHGGHSLTSIVGIQDELEQDLAAHNWAKGFIEKHNNELAGAIIQNRVRDVIGSELPQRDRDPTSISELFKSLLEGGFRGVPQSPPVFDPRGNPNAAESGKPKPKPPNSSPTSKPSNPTVLPNDSELNPSVIPVPGLEPIKPTSHEGTAAPNVSPSLPANPKGAERDKSPASPADNDLTPKTRTDSEQVELPSNPIVDPDDDFDPQAIIDKWFWPNGRPEKKEQVEEESVQANDENHSGSSMIDMIQVALDGIGALEPTPIADLTNAGISMIRAFVDPENAGQHMKNAGLSLISTIPYAGDLAKLAKGYGKSGKTIGNAIEGFANSKAGGLLSGLGSLLGGNKGVGGTSKGSGPSGGGNSGDGSDGAPPTDSNGMPNPGGAPGQLSGQLMNLAVMVGSAIAAFRLLNDWVNSTVESGRKLVEQNRDMAEYSGELSVGMLEYDHRASLRRIKEAEYLGSSASGLASSQSRLEDARSDYLAPYLRATNNVQSGLSEIAALIQTGLSYIDPIRGLLVLIHKALGENPEDDTAPRNMLEAWILKTEQDSGEAKPKARELKLPAVEAKRDLWIG